MRDTIISWALINVFFALLFYGISAFVFWQSSPGVWPAEGRAVLGVAVLVMFGYSSFMMMRNLREE